MTDIQQLNMSFPYFYPNDKTNLQTIVDNQILVYKKNNHIEKLTIGESIKVHLHTICASYSQNLKENLLFNADAILIDVLKPADETEAKFMNWNFSDIKHIKIKKLKTKINQVSLNFYL